MATEEDIHLGIKYLDMQADVGITKPMMGLAQTQEHSSDLGR